jgi:MFS family permease
MIPPPPEIPPLTLRAQAAGGLRGYVSKLRLFSRNARLYLAYTIVIGVAFGIYRLVFNFYVLGLGYDQSFLGKVLTANSLTALLVALPAGYLGDRLGRKYTLFLSSVAASVAVLGMVLWHAPTGLFAMNVLFGAAQSLGAVTLGPFLMENSGEKERTYLFSFASGLQMIAASVGNWMGGWLPSTLGAARGVPATSATAYGMAIVAVAAVASLSVLPVLAIRRRRQARPGKLDLSPFQYARQRPRLLTKLLLPTLVTSLGAGLFMPFMNIFFREKYNMPDETIGNLLAIGSLAMAIGLLVAPPLADRYGKIQVVVISQAVSIPFLIILGFAPFFWLSACAYLVRLSLMNMSGPVYQSFVMERVDEQARATVASLVSMAGSFGWAFSPTVSGWLQVNYGFNPVFALVIGLYIASIYLYWRFFWDREPQPA